MPLDSVFDEASIGLVVVVVEAGVVAAARGLAIGYRQNSWPNNASDDSCWRFCASRNARGSDN